MMDEAAVFLDFSFDPVLYGRSGINSISNDTKDRIEKASKKVANIAAEAGQPSKWIATEEHQIYRLFMTLAPRGIGAVEEEFNTVRKVRKLAYSMSYSEGSSPTIVLSEYLPLALQCIDSFWRYSMFIGVLDALLRNWPKLSNWNGELLRSFISSKVDFYDGKRKTLNGIKNNIQFFSKASGAAQFGAALVAKGEKLLKAFQQIELPQYTVNYGYFGDVAAAFTQTILRKSELEKSTIDISNFLKLHQVKATSKRCYSKIIPALNTIGNQHIQENIKLDALQLIGDPANDTYWEAWEGATPEERANLRNAQVILNEWLTREFVSIFFGKLAMDPDRKSFWLKYVKNISRFKIYGSHLTHYGLSQDERIKPYLDARFGILQDSSGNQSALVMVVKDYVLVEFSLNGAAFYAYRLYNSLCPDISKNTVRHGQLMHPQEMGLLMRRQNRQVLNHQAEGRFSHYKGWESFLAWWLQNYLGV